VARLIVVIFGLMGTGKTTLARALSEARGWPVVHSDQVRKTLVGLEPTIPILEEFGQGIYSEEFSNRTYVEMLRLAHQHLQEAPGVILDGSYKRAAERKRLRQAARQWGAQAVFVYCACPKEIIRARLTRRAENARAISDGRVELLNLQAEDFDPLEEADQPRLTLDTGRELPEALMVVQTFVTRQLGA
jgi:predicted kinase